MCPSLLKQPGAAASMPCRPTSPTHPRTEPDPSSISPHGLEQSLTPPPVSFSCPSPRGRRFEAAGAPFLSFPHPSPEPSTLTPSPVAPIAHEVSQASDTTPLSTGFEADAAASAFTGEPWIRATALQCEPHLTPPFNPLAPTEGPKDYRSPPPIGTPPSQTDSTNPSSHRRLGVSPPVPPCPTPSPFPA
jgi:hypothetical protein